MTLPAAPARLWPDAAPAWKRHVGFTGGHAGFGGVCKPRLAGRRGMVGPRQLIIPSSILAVEPGSFAALLSPAQPGKYAQRVSIVQRSQAGQAIAYELLRRDFVA